MIQSKHRGGNPMRRATTGLACFAATLLAATAAQAQGSVKIGVIMSYSGQFADTGTQINNGMKLYMKEHGDTVAGKKLELIAKDNGGIAPDVAKRLAQEAIVRDKVDIIAVSTSPQTRSRPPTCRPRPRSSWST
jgi:branched-chain amino acid transport system substrate-binding protein